MTDRARNQRSGVLPRGCGQLLRPHQRLSRLYLRICHDHSPLNQQVEILLVAKILTRGCHTRLLSEILADPSLPRRHNRLNLDSDLPTPREREGGSPFHLQNHTPRKVEEAVCGVQEREPAVEVHGGSSRSSARRSGGEGPKVEVPIETEEEDCQMIVDVWMIGRSPALEMVDLPLATTPGKIGALLVREV